MLGTFRPDLLRVCWIAILVGTSVVWADAAIPAAERAALLAFYQATGGGMAWKGNDWGGPPGTEGNWEGVTVEEDHVVAIVLVAKGLDGPLPPEIGDLTALRLLDLTGRDWEIYSGNVIRGIPDEIGLLKDLEVLHKILNVGERELDLAELSLDLPVPVSTGTIPDSIPLSQQEPGAENEAHARQVEPSKPRHEPSEQAEEYEGRVKRQEAVIECLIEDAHDAPWSRLRQTSCH